MKKTTKTFTALLALTAVVAISGCSGESNASDDSVVLKYAFTTAPEHSTAQAEQAWMDAVTEATNGEVTFDVSWSASLCGTAEVSQCLTNGIADLAMGVPGYAPADYPLASVVDVAFGTSDIGAQAKAMNQLYEESEDLQNEFEQLNQRVLHFAPLDIPVVASTNPGLEDIKDLAGERIRSNGSAADGFEALGAAPVTVDLPEIYQSLDRGVIDGAEIPMSSVAELQLAEVATTAYGIAETFGSTTGLQIVMNLDTWNGLTQSQQEAMQDASEESLNTRVEEFLLPGQAEACETLQAAGMKMQVLNVSEETERWAEEQHRVQRNEWAEQSGLDDPDAFFERHLELVEKFETEEGISNSLKMCD